MRVLKQRIPSRYRPSRCSPRGWHHKRYSIPGSRHVATYCSDVLLPMPEVRDDVVLGHSSAIDGDFCNGRKHDLFRDDHHACTLFRARDHGGRVAHNVRGLFPDPYHRGGLRLFRGLFVQRRSYR